MLEIFVITPLVIADEASPQRAFVLITIVQLQFSLVTTILSSWKEIQPKLRPKLSSNEIFYLNLL